MSTASPGGRDPEHPGVYRWARSAGLRVHLTRDDHARPECSKPLLIEHRMKEIKAPGTAMDGVDSKALQELSVVFQCFIQALDEGIELGR